MGTSAQPSTVGSPHQIIMRQCVLFLAFVAPLALAEADAEADPYYGAGYAGAGLAGAGVVGAGVVGVGAAPAVAVAPQCQTVVDQVTSQQCNTVSENVCTTSTVTQTQTRQEQQCTSHPVEECHPVPRTVTENVCTPTTEPECHNVVKTIQEEQCTQEQQCTTQTSTVVETTTTEQCHDVVEQVCAQQHVAVAAPAVAVAAPAVAVAAPAVGVAPVAGVVGAGAVGGVGATGTIANHRIGKREADPEADASYGYAAPVVASAPLCQSVTRKVCQSVPVNVPRTE